MSKLKESIKRSMSGKRVLKESFREDFEDWYDLLAPDEKAKVDAYIEDEGYPDMISDLSVSDMEIIMDHFNPDYFDPFPDDETQLIADESCNESQSTGKLRPFNQNDWYGFAGAEKFPDGSSPLIYEDPSDNGGTVVVSYDSYSDDVAVEVDYINPDGRTMTGFVKTYQGNKDQAIADAEEIISKGVLSSLENANKYFGPDWSLAG